MSNEVLWLLFAITNFLLMMGMYKLFGKTGIFVWVGIATIIANIQVIKSIELFTMSATLGNIMYGTIFLGTDALNEIYGKKQAKRAVLMGFYVLIATLIVMQMMLLFTPGPDDFGQEPLSIIFGFWVRLIIGSLVAFLVSQLLDVTLFQWIKSKLPGNKWLWVRNNGSTILSQAVDTLIFVPIAFIGTMPFESVIEIAISTYLIKLMVALLDTPFLYAMKKIKPLELFKDLG